MHILVQHEVEDFDAWKKVYDDDTPARTEAGLEEIQLLRGYDNPNWVVILMSAKDISEVRAFVNSDHLAQAMKGAGVVGTFIFTELQ